MTTKAFMEMYLKMDSYEEMTIKNEISITIKRGGEFFKYKYKNHAFSPLNFINDQTDQMFILTWMGQIAEITSKQTIYTG